MKKRKLEKKWSGYAVFNLKTGKSKWKKKRDQETRNHGKKLLKGKRLHKPKSGRWTKDFKLLVNNFERKREQNRRDRRSQVIKSGEIVRQTHQRPLSKNKNIN